MGVDERVRGRQAVGDLRLGGDAFCAERLAGNEAGGGECQRDGGGLLREPAVRRRPDRAGRGPRCHRAALHRQGADGRVSE